VLLKTVKEELKDEKAEELTKQLEELEIKEKIPEATKEPKYTVGTTLWTSKVIKNRTFRNHYTNMILMKMPTSYLRKTLISHYSNLVQVIFHRTNRGQICNCS